MITIRREMREVWVVDGCTYADRRTAYANAACSAMVAKYSKLSNAWPKPGPREYITSRLARWLMWRDERRAQIEKDIEDARGDLAGCRCRDYLDFCDQCDVCTNVGAQIKLWQALLTTTGAT